MTLNSRERPSTQTPPATPTKRPTSRRRRLLFVVLSLALPVVGLGCLEAVLRAFGLGGFPSTFVEIGSTGGATVVITDTRGPSSYFFANPNRPGSNDQYTLLKPKPHGTVRIFLAGESAAKGFPQPPALACSAFLQAMLHDVWPERHIEVINLGTTAVASFPVLEIMTEALDYEPDLVIAYVGNNEFFGAYGVASLNRAGRTPTAIRFQRDLRSLAVVQGLERLVRRQAGDERKTLMEVMLGQAYTAPEDPLRADAARNLGYQVGEMIDRCNARGVPIIVCTLPCNERDLAPLGESDVSMLSGSDRAVLAKLMVEAAQPDASSHPSAIASLSETVKKCPTHARAHHILGRAFLAAGDFERARTEFQAAVDLDPMPWRAPQASNDAIRAAVAGHKAILCDAQQVFRSASPGGCIGWELMDDHVHPSLQGQALLARAWVQAMTALDGPNALPRERVDRLAGWEEYARRLGDNPYDRFGVAHTMRVIANIPFFKETNPGAFQRFDALAHSLEARWPAPVLEAAGEWQKPMSHGGGKRPITGMVARALIRTGSYAEAESMLAVAQRCVPLYSSWNLEYVYFMLACREKLYKKLGNDDRRLAQDAIDRGKFLLSHGRSESGQAERWVGRLHQLRGEFAEAIPFLLVARNKLTGTDLVALDDALVISYVKTGRTADARGLIERGIRDSGPFSGLYRQMMNHITGG